MKIATYNVNGINGRLPLLLRWLKEDEPDIVCLQELKSPDDRFPRRELQLAGYEAVWHGQKSWNGVAILARDATPVLTRRGLPGDPDDTHSRYIEAAVDGILIGCLYLPNGNPAPGPKFDYKLRWFERLQTYAADLLALGLPVALVGECRAGIGLEPLEPTQLVVEFRTGRRIPVGQVKTADKDSADGRFDVAAVAVVGVARQSSTRFDRRSAPGEYRHAVPAFLAMPDRAIAGFLDLAGREAFVGTFEFLQANDVG